MNWDDLRFLVVIGREGSLAGAARCLKVDQTTVARRLRALENALATPLFERDEGRWRPTPVGTQVLARAARIEEDVAGLTRIAEAGRDAMTGTVRITSVGTLLANWLTPRLPGLFARHPGLGVELVASNANLNVARREADIALRLARPVQGDFLIRKVAEIGFAVYGPASGAVDGWVGYDDALAHTPEMRWLAEQHGAAPMRLRTASMASLMCAVAAGIGQAILPCLVADPAPGLIRLSGAAPVLTRELWLLIHPDARQQPRVAAVADWLAERIAQDQPAFLGQPPHVADPTAA